MIELKKIDFGYPRSGRLLFGQLSFCLETGGICGLLGKNGSGKSTLLYLMAGLLKPQGGQVRYKRMDVASRDVRVLSDLFFLGETCYLPSVSLEKYVKMNGPFYPRFDFDRMREYLELFEMEKVKNIGALSMGQKRKVSLCFALAADCALTIMDEPTNGLDIPSKRTFRKIVAGQMTEDKLMVISTHQVHELERLMDRVLILQDGRMVLNVTVEQVERCLRFDEYERPERNALFEMPSAKGYRGVFENTGNEESATDMELLFHAAIYRPEEMNGIFNHTKK